MSGNSTLDVLAANAIASCPYGTPNLANDSLDEISLSCSGVGPDFGYVKPVRTSVCESGDEMELTEIMDGDVRFCCSSRRDRERDMLLNIEPEPENDGRCIVARDCARLRPERAETAEASDRSRL